MKIIAIENRVYKIKNKDYEQMISKINRDPQQLSLYDILEEIESKYHPKFYLDTMHNY